MKDNYLQIALDGPSGSGKSTTAKAVAKALDILYIDTGAIFRAFGLKTLRNGIKADDIEKIREMMRTTNVKLTYDKGNMKVFLDDEDVSQAIRENIVSKYASDVSKLGIIRDRVIDIERETASSNSIIMDGRDIGTVVLPNADYKFFLTADSLTRAKRRQIDLKNKGENVDLKVLQAQIEDRDYNDTHREIAPLRCAEDAVKIDTSKLKFDEVVNTILERVKGE